MFIVENHLGDLELEKKETDGLRLYKLPSNEWVPSITSVTSFYNREVFRAVSYTHLTLPTIYSV